MAIGLSLVVVESRYTFHIIPFAKFLHEIFKHLLRLLVDRKNNLFFVFRPPVPDLLCQCSHRQQIIIVIGSLVLHERLAAGTADIIMPRILQHVLHRIWLIVIPG